MEGGGLFPLLPAESTASTLELETQHTCVAPTCPMGHDLVEMKTFIDGECAACRVDKMDLSLSMTCPDCTPSVMKATIECPTCLLHDYRCISCGMVNMPVEYYPLNLPCVEYSGRNITCTGCHMCTKCLYNAGITDICRGCSHACITCETTAVPKMHESSVCTICTFTVEECRICSCAYDNHRRSEMKEFWEKSEYEELQNLCKDCFSTERDKLLPKVRSENPSSMTLQYRLNEKTAEWERYRRAINCLECYKRFWIPDIPSVDPELTNNCRSCDPSDEDVQYLWHGYYWKKIPKRKLKRSRRVRKPPAKKRKPTWFDIHMNLG